MHMVKQTGKGSHKCSCGVTGTAAVMLTHI
jgi:hypothetical protein